MHDSKRFTLHKLYHHTHYALNVMPNPMIIEKHILDALPDAEELALAFIDDPVLCYDAVVHYLRFRPDRAVELAKNYK